MSAHAHAREHEGSVHGMRGRVCDRDEYVVQVFKLVIETEREAGLVERCDWSHIMSEEDGTHARGSVGERSKHILQEVALVIPAQRVGVNAVKPDPQFHRDGFDHLLVCWR